MTDDRLNIRPENAEVASTDAGDVIVAFDDELSIALRPDSAKQLGSTIQSFADRMNNNAE